MKRKLLAVLVSVLLLASMISLEAVSVSATAAEGYIDAKPGVVQIQIWYCNPDLAMSFRVNDVSGFLVNQSTAVTVRNNVVFSDDYLMQLAQAFNIPEMNYTAKDIEACLEYRVYMQYGDYRTATILVDHQQAGLVVLALDRPMGVPYTPLTLRDGSNVTEGEAVYALDVPENYDEYSDVEIWGGVAWRAAELTFQTVDGTRFTKLPCVEHSASGSVGGPLVDSNGCVLGLNIADNGQRSIAVSGGVIMRVLDAAGVVYTADVPVASQPEIDPVKGVANIRLFLSLPEFGMEECIEEYTGIFIGYGTVVTTENVSLTDDFLVHWAYLINNSFGTNYTAHEMKNYFRYHVDGANATLLPKAKDNGVAVFALDAAAIHATPVTLRDSTQVSVGETVYALGMDHFDGTVTVQKGTVSRVADMSFSTVEGSHFSNLHCIQSDVLPTDENVGGPLVDADGYVVGMNFAANSQTSIAIGSREIMDVLDLLGISYATSVMLGDVNGDGRVNNKDLGRLQQWLNGWDVSVQFVACDVIGDGKINNKDLGRLQQYLNEWDVTLG